MDLMQMFRNAPAAPAATGGTGTPAPKPGDPTKPGTGGQVPNPAQKLGPDGQPIISQQQDQSPLADFNGLWEDTPLAEGEQAQPDWNDPLSIVPAMNVDPKKMYEAAQRIDFAKVMPKEKVEAALKGDSQAFNDVINGVAHTVYANMALSTSRIVEAMMKQMAPKLFDALPSHIRKHVVSDTVNTDNPVFNDPAVAPMLDMVKERLQVKNPKANAKEISDMAKKYLAALAATVSGRKGKGGGGGELFNPDGSKKQDLTKTGRGKESWEDFFTPAGSLDEQ